MSQQELQVTKSNLFRQLLQRRVETLEQERNQMKMQIDHLERRLTHSTARHAALSGGGMQKVIAQTMLHVRGLRERAEAEADLTLKMGRPKQEQLFREMERLHDECAELYQMMDEMIEGVHALSEQTQSSVALLIQEATIQQEQLTSELDNLYDDNGILRMAIVEARQNAFNVQERARTQREMLDAKAQAERERLFAQSETLLYESQKLHGALLSATEAAYTIQRWTQLEAAQAALEIHSATKNQQTFNARHEHEDSLLINEDIVLEVAKAAIIEAEQSTQTSHHLSLSRPQRFSDAISNHEKISQGNNIGNQSVSASPWLSSETYSTSTLGLRAMNASNPLLMQRLVLSICLCLVVVLAIAISL